MGDIQGVNVPINVPGTEFVETGLIDATFMGQVSVQRMLYDCLYGRDAQPGALMIGCRHYTTERDSAPVHYNGIV